jgi:acyl-CoA synthetase (AMP-forming)/AMP-acid ligase II
LSHRNILSNAWQIGLVSGIRTGDVYSHEAPMFHSADLHGTMGFLMGCSHVYLPQFTPAAAAALIERFRVTIAHWVPTMIKMFTEAPDVTRHDLSSLRMLFYGSSPMPVEWVRAVFAPVFRHRALPLLWPHGDLAAAHHPGQRELPRLS